MRSRLIICKSNVECNKFKLMNQISQWNESGVTAWAADYREVKGALLIYHCSKWPNQLLLLAARQFVCIVFMPQPSYPISVKSWINRKFTLQLSGILPYYYFCSIKYACYAVAYKDLLHSWNTQIYSITFMYNCIYCKQFHNWPSIVCSMQQTVHYSIWSLSVFSYFTGIKKWYIQNWEIMRLILMLILKQITEKLQLYFIL